MLKTLEKIDYPKEWDELPKKERKKKIKEFKRETRNKSELIKKVRYIGFIGITIVVVVGGLWRLGSSSAKQRSQAIEGVVEYTKTERNHVGGEVDYQESPPAGGSHNPVWVSCNGNVYDQPVVNEQAVHALEHGAVWITHKPDLATDAVNALKDKVQGYTFMSPYENQETPLVLTAWGNQLPLESPDDPRIDQFLQKFRQGAQTPEPGATCNAVPGGMR